MGVIRRDRSPYWHLWLERAPRGKQRVNTKILIGTTPAQQRVSYQLALNLYHKRMLELAADAQDIPGLPRESILFREYAEWYSTHIMPRRKGAAREREIMPRLVQYFGRFALEQITRAKAHEYMTWRLSQPIRVTQAWRTKAREIRATPSTVNREIDVLKAILQSAVPEHIASSPLYGMPRLRTIEPQRRILQPDEERRLLSALAPDDRALFLIGLDSLVRLSDILDLRRQHDRGNRIWIADPKAGGGYEVPLSRRARAALDAVQPDGQGYYFGRRRRARTERDRRNVIRQMLRRACARAGIPYGRTHGGITFHWATRRTGATRMLTSGVDVGTVQKVGRWKTPDVVLGIYHALMDEHAVAAVEAVGQRSARSARRRPTS